MKKKATRACRKQEPMVRTLRELLADAESRFGDTSRGATCFDFHLGRFPNGWEFTVVNDWHKWMDAGRRHRFGRFPTPEAAVCAFLEYVQAEHINPAGLTHER